MDSFERFAAAFRAEFAPGYGAQLAPGIDLYEELGLDSFAAFRMILFVEDLADVPFPPDDIPPMFTVGDVFAYYSVLCDFARGE